jgi:PKD-like domain
LCSDSPNSPSQTNIILSSTTQPTSGVITFDYDAVSSPPGAVTGFLAGQRNLPPTTIADKLVNSSNGVATVAYSITPRALGAKNGSSCSQSSPTIVTITVEPKPKISIAPSSQVVCSGTPTTMTLSTTTVPSGSGSIQFTRKNRFATGGMTTSSTKTIYLNNEQIGDVWNNPTPFVQTVTYTFRADIVGGSGLGCQSEDVIVTLSVAPKPVITPVANFSICSGESFNPITIPVDTDIADPGSTIVSWSVTPNSNVTGESNGSGNAFSQVLFNTTSDKVVVQYLLKAKYVGSFPNCSGTDIPLNVTVYPNPKLVGLPTSQNVCNLGTLAPNPYPLASSTVASLGTTFDWIVDNGGNLDLPPIGAVTNGTAINQTFTNNGTSLGTYQYSSHPFGRIRSFEYKSNCK